MSRIFALLVTMAFVASPALCQEEGFTRFHTAGEGALFNLGPTGIWGYGPHTAGKGATYEDPNFFIVDRAEVGSPAHGLISKHDVITGVNGAAFAKGKDPRFALAYAIEDSEAKDGKLQLQVNRGGETITVTLQLEEIPAHSATWPFDCERTDTVLNNACDHLAREQMPEGDVVADDGNIGPLHAGLLWLAVGEPRYLQNALHAAYWYSDQTEANKFGWSWTMGYGGLLMAEYYHMTGDKNILPGLERVAARIATGQMPSGGWSHGSYSGFGAGYGEVNCTGMINYMALLEARECGVKVDEAAIRKADRFFDRYAPSLSNSYGNHGWGFGKSTRYSGMNGKIGGMAVAHRLNDRDLDSANYAIKASRCVDGIEGGHTGHYFNMMWTPIAASLAPPREYRRTMDQIGWYFTMARTWRGSLYCSPVGGQKYSNEGGPNMTTGGYGLVLAVPRRHLRILGAPKSVFVVDLPPELEAARTLHQANKWDDAIAAVAAFLEKGGHDKEAVRLANELRDKSRYVKAGIEQAYTKLEELGSGAGRGARLGSRPTKASGMIKHLRMMLGDDDARLKEIEANFPEKFRGIWIHGEEYHQAFRTLHQLKTYRWFIFASLLEDSIPDLAVPPDSPVWTPLVTVPEQGQGKGWKAIALWDPAKAPAGWTGRGFDDSGWKEAANGVTTKKGRSRDVQADGYYLIRMPFELTNTNAKRLRLSIVGRNVNLSPGAEVFLNGTRILNTYSGTRGSVDLLPNARRLLRKGPNLLAIMSQGSRNMPRLALEAEMGAGGDAFAWTPVPGRDAGIRKLAAKRSTPQKYYEVEKDRRTPGQLMAVFTAEPFFMPEAHYAIERFLKILPDVEEQTRSVESLLTSGNWGARWTGLYLVYHAMTPSQMRGRPSDEEKAADAARVAAGKAWGQQFQPQVIKLLDDPHHTVRLYACMVVELYGGQAKDAIPALARLQRDVDGQNWMVRNAAFRALCNMPMKDLTRQAVMRAGLKDPDSNARGLVLGASFNSKDEATRKAAFQTYKEELIDQVFDAPHGMFTKKTRSQMAENVIMELTKDEIRPHLPRFFTSLNRPGGEQLKGSQAVLASFGDEVVPKLKKLAMSDDENTRYNSIGTLLQMKGMDKLSAEMKDFIKEQLKPMLASEDAKRASEVQKLLDELEGKDS